MNGIACACASEVCAVMGCQRVREIREKHLQRQAEPFRGSTLLPHGQPVGAGDGHTYIPQYVTEHDVRRIIREELQRALAAVATPGAPDGN